MKTKIYIILLALLSFVINSCDTSVDTDIDSQSVEDDARAQDAVADAFAIVNGNGQEGGGKMMSECATISWSGAVGARVCTIDFGASGCQGPDGVTRAGKIITTFTGIWGEGVVATTTFENYSVEGQTLSGTMVATYQKSLPNPEFSITVSGATLTTTEGTISWSSTTTTKMIAGGLTLLDRSDDEFEINYASTGTNTEGKEFTTAASGIHKIYGCKYPVEGIITIVQEGIALDFDEDGNSANTPECNNKAKVTKNGISVIVNL